MPNYKNAKIYDIKCNITGDIYVGATTQKLCNRMTGHRSDAKRNTSCRSKQIINRRDYSYSLIEDYPCDRKEQLTARERYWIEKLECVNKVIPGRTKKGYYQDNKEKLKEYKKQYRKDNKEKIKESHKEYQKDNKDKIKEIRKKYYEKNKEEINRKRRESYAKKKANA